MIKVRFRNSYGDEEHSIACSSIRWIGPLGHFVLVDVNNKTIERINPYYLEVNETNETKEGKWEVQHVFKPHII